MIDATGMAFRQCCGMSRQWGGGGGGEAGGGGG